MQKKQKKVAAVMDYYAAMSKTMEHGDFRWSPVRRRFSLDKANAFFVGVLLDQGQRAERAWDGGRHLVDHYFTGSGGFWGEILAAHPQTVKRICTSGYDGTSYASVYCTNKFPRWLRSAAGIMQRDFEGDPRNIWAVPPDDVGLIYDRFVQFGGIGDALAKMAQFILARNYRVAGGKQNQSRMSVKPDVLVRRVLYRLGIAASEGLPDVLGTLEAIRVKRPADFDASLWVVGREFCLKTNPKCDACPLRPQCDHA